MKKFVVIGLTALAFAACSDKDVVRPPVEVIVKDLHNMEVKYGYDQVIDLDGDGAKDIGFSSWFIGDPVEQEDEILFFAKSYTHSLLLVDDNNGSPRFNQKSVIPINGYPGHEWYKVSMVELVTKNAGTDEIVYWDGAWLNVQRKFLAVQVLKDNKRYNGWVELSVETSKNRIILHRAAISKQPEKSIVAD